MKKVFKVVATAALALTAAVTVSACSNGGDSFKVGFICLHDENSTYDKNFIEAAKDVQKELGLSKKQVIIKTGIPEGNECYNEAKKLVNQGCDVIFADSFGHEEYLMKAAKEFPEVQFCHATGTNAHTAELPNLHNAFASIYEGRYLAGMAAGYKLNEMIAAGTITEAQAKMGYVGAFTYAEVMSGYTSFYLGAKSICPSVTMDVSFTGSWYDYDAEKETAKKLINSGCVLISQHADSQGAPEACQEAGVPNVFYNGTNESKSTWLASSKIDWRPYFRMIMDETKTTTIPTDYTGTINTGSVWYTVDYTDLTTTKDTAKAAIEAVEASMKAGTFKVFDTTKFTVGGSAITSYTADVDTDPDFTPDTEAIENGQFVESTKRSAPYFDVEIDGITLVDRNYGD